MRFMVIALTVLQFAAGALVFLGSKSAIHEILGALLFGFGGVMLALIAVLNAIERRN